jgi:hypothetical protein
MLSGVHYFEVAATISRDHSGGSVGVTTMGSHMDGASVAEIAFQLCALLDQQMQAVSGRGLEGLSDEEAANYELRRKQIAALRAELGTLAKPN